MAPKHQHILSRRSAIGQNLTQTATIELILPLIATIAVALRLGLRQKSKIAFGWDDLLMVLCLPFVWGLWGVNYWLCSTVVESTTSQLLSVAFPEFLKACFILEFVYVNGCNLIKFSILAFYYRCFCSGPTSGTPRRWLLALGIFLAAYTVARFFATFFECTPVRYFWNRTQPGTCLNFRVLLITLQSANLVTDVAILFYPVPIIWQLHKMPLRKKLGITILFLLGALACGSSAFRIYFVARIFDGNPASLLADDATPKLVICAMMEMNVALLTACLPTMKAPLKAIFAGWLKCSRKELVSDHIQVTLSLPQPPRRPSVFTAAMLDIEKETMHSESTEKSDWHG